MESHHEKSGHPADWFLKSSIVSEAHVAGSPSFQINVRISKVSGKKVFVCNTCVINAPVFAPENVRETRIFTGEQTIEKFQISIDWMRGLRLPCDPRICRESAGVPQNRLAELLFASSRILSKTQVL